MRGVDAGHARQYEGESRQQYQPTPAGGDGTGEEGGSIHGANLGPPVGKRKCSRAASYSGTAQAQRIGDDADRTERHGGGGDGGRQQHAHRHEAMRRTHPHYPDLHHRHGHAALASDEAPLT